MVQEEEGAGGEMDQEYANDPERCSLKNGKKRVYC